MILLFKLIWIAFTSRISLLPAHPSRGVDSIVDGDETWPIRESEEPWDISTDYPYPRKLEYDVEEGTWLHLDVHPINGDIVFAMAGDLYCIPHFEYIHNIKARARPILLGVPHDSDPAFDRSGNSLAFRSDAISGVENIWIMPWSACETMDLSPTALSSSNPQLTNALHFKHLDQERLIRGEKETPQRRGRRLFQEGRHSARRVTNETYRWVTSPRFHSTNASRIIAIRWMTPTGSDIGAPEGWEYEVQPPNSSESYNITPRSGKRIVGRTLPLGYTPDRYHELHIGPEQFIWFENDCLIFSKNVQEDFYHYGKDVHQGIYSIQLFNLTSGMTSTLVNSSPGSASRPQLSRDQRTLAFVRRVRDKELLVFKDLVTGTLRYIWDGLTYDLTSIHAPSSTYPSFAFSPSDDSIIIWAAGKIWEVPLAINMRGERLAGDPPRIIPFYAHIEKQLAPTMHTSMNLVHKESQSVSRITALKELRVDDSKTRLVFQAGGTNVVQILGQPNVTHIPTLCREPECAYYHPSFVPGHPNLVLHARWSNVDLSSFEIADISQERALPILGTPFGKYISPIISNSLSHIVFVKTADDTATGEAVATANPGVYLGEIIDIFSRPTVRNLRYIASDIDLAIFPANRVQLRFVEDDSALLVEQNTRAFLIHLSPDSSGEYPRKDVASGKMSMEVASSLESRPSAQAIAFVDYFQLYVVFASLPSNTPVWSRPQNATDGIMRLSTHGGHDITFSSDGTMLFWLFGPQIHHISMHDLSLCSNEVKADRKTFGIVCIDKLVKRHEIYVFHSTDISRLKQEAKKWDRHGSDTLVFTNATLLTMESGTSTDLIHNGTVVVTGGLIESIGASIPLLPSNVTVIDAQGGYILPGFIDLHAHWFGCFFSRYPSSSWELEAFLAMGVTTVHNPSAHNVEAFAERFRVEKGLAVGPRILSVGNIIYGSARDIHQDIIDEDAATSALLRIKVEGEGYALGYKNYGISSRAARQRLMLAARNLSMLAFPEAGMNYDWDLTYIIDGMTTVEHALPIPVLYDDVTLLFAKSGTGVTPTHIINYHGAFGEELVWRNEPSNFNTKLREFIPHSKLEVLSETMHRPPSSYSITNTSRSVARMVKLGLSAHVGAHGEQPFGLNYHAEMAFMAAGGLNNLDVLTSATSTAAKTLGIFSSLGSLTPGKLGDLVVYPPGVDLLNGIIDHTRDLKYVMRGGRMWNANDLVEMWPVPGRTIVLPPTNPL